jgi:multimeric flavodoxin WrbA
MKAVILNGSNNDWSTLNIVEDIFVKELRKNEWEVEIFELRNKSLATCIGCFGCWINTPGQCIQKDEGNEITKAVARSDLLILLSPVTFGGYSFHLKKMLDRLIPNLLPHFTKINGEIHHKYRYERSPRLLAVGYLTKHDKESEKIFKLLLSRNALNMHSSANYAEVCTGNMTNFNEGKIITLLKNIEAIV